MAIRPIEFNADGSVQVWHDEANHGGVLKSEEIVFAKALDGGEDLRFLVMPCPVPGCGSESFHPVGGGCDPERVQMLFVKKLQGHPSDSFKAESEARTAVKSLIRSMGSGERWVLDDARRTPTYRNAQASAPTDSQ